MDLMFAFMFGRELLSVKIADRVAGIGGKYNPTRIGHVHKDGTEFTMLMNGILFLSSKKLQHRWLQRQEKSELPTFLLHCFASIFRQKVFSIVCEWASSSYDTAQFLDFWYIFS